MAHCAVNSILVNVAFLDLHTAVDKQEHMQMHEPIKKLIHTIVFKSSEYSSHFITRQANPKQS